MGYYVIVDYVGLNYYFVLANSMNRRGLIMDTKKKIIMKIIFVWVHQMYRMR